MSTFDDKHKELKKRGVILGDPLAEIEDAGFGGKMRRYERGNIYSHPNAGTHEVHGQILELYLKHGGPGFNETSGQRHFGFPVGDQEFMPGTEIPQGRFETGAIYAVPDTGGCAVFGPLYDPARAQSLGLPLTGNFETASFVACYFERGIRVKAKGITGENPFLDGIIRLPLMGRPKIINTKEEETRTFNNFCDFKGIKRKQFDQIIQRSPNFFRDLIADRLVLAPVDQTSPQVQISVATAGPTSQTQFFVDVAISLEVKAGQAVDVQERTLYHLALSMPNLTQYLLSPHAVYAKSDWDNFGLLHITDLHISLRNEEFARKLGKRNLNDAAKNYANFQDSFKDFIKYANKLHKLGMADAVIATGDLVDYVSEDEDDDHLAGNYDRFRRIILGKRVARGDLPTEPLQIPIFVTFGNHDYRLHPYDLRSDVDLPGSSKDRGLAEFSGHNLIESDALAIQDGKTPTYTTSNIAGAGRMLEVDRFDNKYDFFKKYISSSFSYKVRLGRHRLVVLDTKFDNGLPDDFDILTLLNVAFGGDGLLSGQFGSGLPTAQKLLAGGAPDSAGFGTSELGIVREALVEAGPDGLVIVGMHAPPLSPKGGEYPFYFRETMHPSTSERLIDAYVRANDLEGSSWTKIGTPFFKAGDTSDGMDKGVIANNREEFLGICSGQNARPVDLVLTGHHHDRVEYRVKWNASASEHEFFMDFYTENPGSYYHTKNFLRQTSSQPVPREAPIRVLIEEGAPPAGEITVVRDNTGNGPERVFGEVKTPPYATPLNSTGDAKKWWADHRPLIVQTSALGPIDPRQRFGRFFKITPPAKEFRPIIESTSVPPQQDGKTVEELPGAVLQPTFQGFRLVQVRAGVITKMRYVVLRDLRRSKFRTLWEFGDFDASVIQGVVLTQDKPEPAPKPSVLSGIGGIASGSFVAGTLNTLEEDKDK